MDRDDDSDHDGEIDQETLDQIDPVAASMLSGTEAQTSLNSKDDQLPFGLYNPDTMGKLTWICGPDAKGNITSVYCFDYGDRKERACAEVESHARAIEIRNELMAHGWKFLAPPKITFSMNGVNQDRPLTRKQKRYLARKITQASRQLGEGGTLPHQHH